MKPAQENSPEQVSININLIDIQQHISNRIKNDIASTSHFLKFMTSIETTKGLIQPIVVREMGTGRYELFVGFKRNLVYQALFKSGNTMYKFIPASVYPKETTTKDMILKTFHENKFRKDPEKVESLHSQISMLPFIIGRGRENQKKDNFLLGHKILSVYISYKRSPTHADKYLKKLSDLTQNNNPIDKLEEFFAKLIVSPESFLLSSRVLFECTREIRVLFTKGKITNRHALGIHKMKSDEDKNEILKQLEKGKVAYKKIEDFIRESNAKFSPAKKTKKILQLVQHVSVQIKSREETFTEDEINEIKMHVEKIENIVQK